MFGDRINPSQAFQALAWHVYHKKNAVRYGLRR